MSAVGNSRKAETLERAFAGRSLWADARTRLFRNRAAVASMIVLALISLMALLSLSTTNTFWLLSIATATGPLKPPPSTLEVL